MSLKQFDKEFHVKKKPLNVVICIYHTVGLHRESVINKMLEEVQLGLKEECNAYQEIQVAYVYETLSLLDVKQFQKLKKETPIYYKEPCGSHKMMHNLAHVWFMALAVLEKQVNKMDCETENRLYFLTDEKFSRVEVNQLFVEENGKLMIHPRFSKLSFIPFLKKTKHAGGDLLEQYIYAYNHGKNISVEPIVEK